MHHITTPSHKPSSLHGAPPPPLHSPLLHHHHHHYHQQQHVPLRLVVVLLVVVGVFGYHLGASCHLVPPTAAVSSTTVAAATSDRPIVVGRGTFQGSSPLANPTTRGVTVLAENEWLRLESHRVAAPSRRAKKKGGSGGASSETIIDDWWWVRVPDHVNVMVHVSLETARSLLATPRHGLHVGLRGLGATPAARALLAESATSSTAAAASAVGLFVLMRQSKYGFDGAKVSWAVVGGLRNDTTDGPMGLAITAKRELNEELGLISDDWVHFGDLRVDANRGCGTIGTFMAKNARPELAPHERRPPPTDDDADEDTGDLELQKPYLVALSDLLHLVSTRGEVLELKWTHTISRAWMHFHTTAAATRPTE